MIPFVDYLWDLFPSYYTDKDSYKNENGKGLLERFIRAHGEELDEKIVPAIANFLDVLNPETENSKYIPHIAYQLGSPSNIFNTPSKYKDLLNKVIGIYKRKGTKQSYEDAFRLVGIKPILIMILSPRTVMDIGLKMDTGMLMDVSLRAHVGYSISILDLKGKPLTSNLEIEKITNLIRSLVEPEHMNFLGINVLPADFYDDNFYNPEFYN
jgi:hypothetical protein